MAAVKLSSLSLKGNTDSISTRSKFKNLGSFTSCNGIIQLFFVTFAFFCSPKMPDNLTQNETRCCNDIKGKLD